MCCIEIKYSVEVFTSVKLFMRIKKNGYQKYSFGEKYTTPRHTTKRTAGPGRKNKTTNDNMNNEVCIAHNTLLYKFMI